MIARAAIAIAGKYEYALPGRKRNFETGKLCLIKAGSFELVPSTSLSAVTSRLYRGAYEYHPYANRGYAKRDRLAVARALVPGKESAQLKK